MDYAEEQAGEIEALQSIYEGDLEGEILSLIFGNDWNQESRLFKKIAIA